MRKAVSSSTLRRVATGLYLAGAASLLAAYFTGRNDAELVRFPGPAHARQGTNQLNSSRSRETGSASTLSAIRNCRSPGYTTYSR